MKAALRRQAGSGRFDPLRRFARSAAERGGGVGESRRGGRESDRNLHSLRRGGDADSAALHSSAAIWPARSCSLARTARRFKVGDRVWGSNQGLLGRQGTFAELAAVDECWLVSDARVA